MAPPIRTANFSISRHPGVVFRVSRIMQPVPFTASTQIFEMVATPDSRERKFNAVRSAKSKSVTFPVASKINSPALTLLPSGICLAKVIAEFPAISSTACAAKIPATTPAFLALN